jgi:hypothetical protein
MPVKRKIPYSNGHFFITFTCYNWLPLIEQSNSYDLIYKWFDSFAAGSLPERSQAMSGAADRRNANVNKWFALVP